MRLNYVQKITMNTRLKVILLLILPLSLIVAGCSSSSTPASTSSTYYLESNLLGEKNEFLVDSQGVLLSKVEASSAGGRISLSIDKGTRLLNKDGEPLQTIQAVIDPSPPLPPQDVYIIGQVYNLEPEEATFSPWLVLTLSYNSGELPEGIGENDLYVVAYDVGWYLLPYKNVDTKTQSITTLVYHFTRFAIIAPKKSAPPSTTTPAQGIKVGNLAPDFQLNNLKGEPVSLSSLRGRPVLINFWATWCRACRIEMPYLQQVYEEWSDKGLVLLAINLGESLSKVEEFVKNYNLSFPVLLDTNQAISLRYNVRYIPTTFLIDKDGIIQEVKIGAFRSTAELEESLSKIIP